MNALVAFFAIMGLIIEFRVWQFTFEDRFKLGYFENYKNLNTSYFTEIFLMFTTAFALICLFFKHYAAQVWSDYPDSVKFYKQIVREQYLNIDDDR